MLTPSDARWASNLWRHTLIADDAFHDLREKAQNAGVYVVLMGDLGNYHSRVEPDEFRGIAIAEQFAPLIVINSYDPKVARPCEFSFQVQGLGATP